MVFVQSEILNIGDKIPCVKCNAAYYGETGEHMHTRAKSDISKFWLWFWKEADLHEAQIGIIQLCWKVYKPGSSWSPAPSSLFSGSWNMKRNRRRNMRNMRRRMRRKQRRMKRRMIISRRRRRRWRGIKKKTTRMIMRRRRKRRVRVPRRKRIRSE